jgi:hypothetical protein
MKPNAHEIYFRLFGLIYDEIRAYDDGFVTEDVFVGWITWQMYDHMNGEFKIGGVSYDEGWRWWLTTPGQYSPYTDMLKEIFKCCKERACVKDIIEYRMSSRLLKLMFKQRPTRSCEASGPF